MNRVVLSYGRRVAFGNGQDLGWTKQLVNATLLPANLSGALPYAWSWKRKTQILGRGNVAGHGGFLVERTGVRDVR
jgi:hypothetical protein